MWERFRDSKGGILVVGHGTRVPDGVAQMLALASQLQSLVPKLPTEASFLELARPTIEEGMSRLREQGVQRILVIPILLFEAGHARSDIPAQCLITAAELGLSIIGQSPPLGTLDAALELSEFRFAQALACTHRDGCAQAGACAEFERCRLGTRHPVSSGSRVALAMVGRGTSEASALDHMRRFTSMRVARSPVPIAWSETGFFVGGSPSLDELLWQAFQSECETVVVQPHLLFEGELTRQLRAKVEKIPRKPHQRYLITPPLGADPRLAAAFLDLASQTLRESPTSGD